MSLSDSPTPFQRKVCWAGLSSVAALALVSVILIAGWSVIYLCGYLKPVLTPIAIAAVLAYLLTPVVALLCRWRIPRTWAVIIVFVAFSAGLALIGLTVAPSITHQGSVFVSKLPSYSQKIASLAKGSAEEIQRISDLKAHSAPTRSLLEDLSPENIKLYSYGLVVDALQWLQQKLPTIASASGTFLQKSIGGVFGVLGFLLSLVLVPIFLFFFLLESPRIAEHWSRYIPLRASPLKEEIVSLLNEINDYLIHFFRGQLLVSLIDGAIVGICLFIFLRLDFSFLIGLMVGILCLIPYFGMILCIIPAVLIALAQYGDLWHPTIVLIIFTAAHNLDGIFISPKVIGNSVGLHPMTIIISVFAWTIVLGGLLGALLAVPLTATLKVLLRRYFWDRPPSPAVQQTLKIEETIEKKTIAVELPL
jgi:predicted PurR-regulated permease PerM